MALKCHGMACFSLFIPFIYFRYLEFGCSASNFKQLVKWPSKRTSAWSWPRQTPPPLDFSSPWGATFISTVPDNHTFTGDCHMAVMGSRVTFRSCLKSHLLAKSIEIESGAPDTDNGRILYIHGIIYYKTPSIELHSLHVNWLRLSIDSNHSHSPNHLENGQKPIFKIYF